MKYQVAQKTFEGAKNKSAGKPMVNENGTIINPKSEKIVKEKEENRKKLDKMIKKF